MKAREERLHVLKMLSEGKLSPEEAEELLSAIDENRSGVVGEEAVGGGTEPPPFPPGVVQSIQQRNRSVRVVVRDGDDTTVNVSVPLPLIRSIGRFIPREAIDGKVKGFGGDIDIDVDAIIRAVEDGAEGKLIDIQDGATRIEMWVE